MLESRANGEGGVMATALETYQVSLPDLLADPNILARQPLICKNG